MSKRPPSTWYYGVIKTPISGLKPGTRIAIRRSREGGWRILSRTQQTMITDSEVTKYVTIPLENGKPIPVQNQESANLHLADIFHHRVWKGRPIPYGIVELSLVE